MNGENPRLKTPLLPWCVQSSLSSASSTQHMWQLLAGNRAAVLPREAEKETRGEDGSWVWCMCTPCFNLSFENSDLNCSLHKEFEISTLHSKFFEILKFVFLSEVAHKPFWVKFSGLISKLKILEKSY